MKKQEFFNKVYEIVSKIPKGKVMTYGQIAVLLDSPNCARGVGQALNNTPEFLNIPAHRVVNSQGRLAPDHVFGGNEIQRDLLEQEGVPFKQNGYIDIEKAIYRLNI